MMSSRHETGSRDRTEAMRWFCARCDREVARVESGACRDRSPICPRCGDRLELQGYCPVCEACWRLAVATLCPKHDLPLEPGPPVEGPAADRAPRSDWTTVAVFARPADAEAPRLRLEAEGIPTFLDGERAGSLQHPALSAVRLLVPGDLLPDARVLLAQSWSPVVTPDDLDEAGAEIEPDPAARRKDVIRLVVLAWVVASLAYLAWTAVPALLG